ncbi:uncharacterized protein [Amphiura filiformis]|uniref:uncharacterized protein n=1 Tax=Amphiura filiformis TaxID=82378 RepID=UPI003B220834
MTTLESAGFHQHVIGPTHISGSTLDLVFSCTEENLVTDCFVDPRLSDHHVVCFKICQQKSHSQKHVIVSRKLHLMDVPSFEADFHLLLESSDSQIEDLADHYNRVIKTTLDKHAPEKRSTRSTRLHQPWYNNSIHEARRVRRKHERKWRKSRLEVDHQLYVVQREQVNSLICVAKQEYYKNELAQADTKTVFKKVNTLLNRSTKALPAHESSQDLSNNEKVSNIYKCLENDVVELCNETFTNVDPERSASCSLTNFDVLSENDVLEYVQKSPAKSCCLDPIPTWLIKQHPDMFVPIITKITNDSLMTGAFPACLKQAIVTPLIKKQSLNPETLKNYRPVSNIPYVSKVIEKHVIKQISAYMESNELCDPLQSAYRPLHSTETALLKVKSDIMQHLAKREGVFLVLLDLSAAFDTVNHCALLNRLTSDFCIGGVL